MNKKIVIVVLVVVLSATVIPVAGFLPNEAGFARQIQQIDSSSSNIAGENDIWPMFRQNPGNTGYSSFDAPFTNHLAWKKTIDTEIYGATPILYADKLYISTNWFYKGLQKITDLFSITPPSLSDIYNSLISHQNDTTTGLYCFDAKTGEQQWFQPMIAPNDPAIVDDKLYIVDSGAYYSSSLYCLGVTGDILWQKSINGLILSPTIVADQKIFLGCLDLYTTAGSVLCYDLSGNPVWNKPLAPYEMIWFSAPAYSGGYVYFITTNWYGYNSGRLYCLNAATGQSIWSHSVFSFGLYFYENPSAVCADGKIYVTDFNINTYEGLLRCYDGMTGDTLWTCPLGSVLSFISPAVCPDSVYVTGTELYMYNTWLYRIAANGTYLWRMPIPTTSYLWFGSLICSADKIIVTPGSTYGYSNELICFERFDGTAEWHFLTDSYILGQPSIGDSRVYLADQIGTIYAFEDALKIQNISGGLLGVKVKIQNTGTISLTNFTWNISVEGGYFSLINRVRIGMIKELPAGTSKIIRLLPLFGIGPVEIVVKVNLPNSNTIKKVAEGMLFGPICFITS